MRRPDALVAALALLPLGLLLAPACRARDIPYGEVGDPAVRRCDALNWSPQHAAAADCYRALAQREAGGGDGVRLAEAAEGTWALGDLVHANALFRAAAAARPRDATLQARWGELYVDSHQPQQALDLFHEALARDAHDAYARLDAASVLDDQFAVQAQAQLRAAMADPAAPAGARLRGLLLSAGAALEEGDADSARSLLDQAQAIATSARLPQLEVDALRAALAQLEGEDDASWIERALQEDPAFGEAYALPAHIEDIRWRARDAIALYRQAIAIEPTLWSARVQLGDCLLRQGELAEGRAMLESAYRGDPYDPVTVNLLRLSDSLQHFAVRSYDRASDGGPALVLHISNAEVQVLAPYVRRLAQRALSTYAQRYRFQPRTAVQIEVYPHQDDLAVRTAGLPGLEGELGVTFGYVVAIDSPASRPIGDFDWGDTLWHEMAHVFTLESTDFHVPRWLTEGLSVFEEWRTGPGAGVQIPAYVLAAFAQRRELPVARLNAGFVHPQYPEQVVVSYMQAGLICDYIDRAFGFDRLRALLQAFARTSDVSAAMQMALGLSATQFDARFAADLQQQYGRVLAQMDRWLALRTEAERAATQHDWSAAQAAATQALALQAQDVGEDSPYLPLAQAYVAQNAPARALATLSDYAQRGGHDPQALRTLATGLYAAGRSAEAIRVLDGINDIAPFDEALHGQLGDWLLQAGRAAEALAEYRVALALNPPDRATAHLRLARAQYALHDWPAARREVIASLEVAPNFRPAQQLLLQLAAAPKSTY
ncbi:MAG TPA: tetratricopeptide repeat protein [Steroidobacteraceae bacterium]|jgi:Tfp pilus assembly protein PilF/Flp pilus assembly protein TadD|nr:tetratricopeptide repeat protein [Steroidobacteraceae bacterium]